MQSGGAFEFQDQTAVVPRELLVLLLALLLVPMRPFLHHFSQEIATSKML
jgi:hypothetical protein